MGLNSSVEFQEGAADLGGETALLDRFPGQQTLALQRVWVQKSPVTPTGHDCMPERSPFRIWIEGQYSLRHMMVSARLVAEGSKGRSDPYLKSES